MPTKRREPPPHLYFVVSAAFHYLGPSFAVLLFARVAVLGVAWLRIASAAAVFALWRRPWGAFRRADGDARRLLVAWGAVLAVMNCCFYEAIDRLPLGTVAAIEFLPVIVLAAIGARTARNGAALALAVPGVYLLTDVQLAGEPLGVAFAAANAVLFAAYIVLAHRVAQRGDVGGLDGLAAAMLIAVVVVSPLGGWEAAPAFSDPVVLLAGIGVGLSSSVIPYVSDHVAMRRLPRATYALMVSLLPATATIVGIVVLAQIPSPVEVVGVALVVAGIAVHREPTEPTEVHHTGRAPALATSDFLPRRHPKRPVQPNDLAVEHWVLDDGLDELGELRRFAEAVRERHRGTQRLTRLLREEREQRRVEEARRDRDHADARGGEVAGGGERHPHDPALRRGVGELADLAVVRRRGGGVDVDPTLALRVRVVAEHRHGGEA